MGTHLTFDEGMYRIDGQGIVDACLVGGIFGEGDRYHVWLRPQDDGHLTCGRVGLSLPLAIDVELVMVTGSSQKPSNPLPHGPKTRRCAIAGGNVHHVPQTPG